ncbi:MAG: tetrahydromethanopterin S-methyltransferase subunit H [Thermoleophilia bacterium]
MMQSVGEATGVARYPAEVRAAGVPLGGPPGLHPTLLVGSIFYDRHGIVSDMKAGLFDEAAAADLLAEQDRWSFSTGNPCMVDVVASSPQAIERYLEFVMARTQAPVMVDGSSPAVRIAGLRWAARAGVIDRVVYNSLSPESGPEEFAALAETGCRSVVVLSLASSDLSLEGRLRPLRGADGLVARARQAGVEAVLIDPGVIDLPSLGVAREAMHLIQAEHGLPTGTAAHNAVGTWGGLRDGKLGREAVRPLTAVVDALNTAWGGSFLLYGPLSLASLVFPAVATVDACLAQTLLEAGTMVDLDHPLFRIA